MSHPGRSLVKLFNGYLRGKGSDIIRNPVAGFDRAAKDIPSAK